MGVLVYFKILICKFICSLAKAKRENVDFGYVFEWNLSYFLWEFNPT